jgi:hypothetical protein
MGARRRCRRADLDRCAGDGAVAALTTAIATATASAQLEVDARPARSGGWRHRVAGLARSRGGGP